MRGPLAGWRLPLRLAWRDARRAKGRSLLVLVMIALPVMGVAAADTLYSTQSVSGVEGLERRLGTAEARVSLAPGSREAVQDADPDTGVSAVGPRRDPGRATLTDVERVLGVSDLPAVELETESTRAATDDGQTYVELTGTDLLDPLTRGLVEPVSGRLPRTDGEVVVNADLAERGPGVGEELELAGGTRLEVVGIVESAQGRGFPMAWARPAAVDGQGAGSTLLIGGAAVTWEQVRALNALGATVLSRAVVTDPPPESALPPEIRGFDEGIDEATVTVLALVVVMVLIEVVLLAGPAFAVGARRQSRTLALIAAAGGVPGQARRVVLATGVVLGSLGAVLGLALGLLAAVALTPVLQGFSTTRFGPFDVTWLHLAGIAAFGTLSALLAAAVPAWIASRQDVVA
ncbi:MAG: ABC transporter permease, partial [Nocardioides kribbensis]